MTLRRIVLFALVTAAVGLTYRVEATTADTPRTLYVSAADAKGTAITDLTAADLAVKEGGQDRAVASLKPAEGPIDLAIIVDDNGSGFFLPAVLQLLQTVGDDAKYSIRRFSPQADKILDYSSDVGSIQKALDLLGARGKVQNDGEQLLQAISETAKELQQRKTARRIMLVCTLTGEGQAKNGDLIMTDLPNTGVILNVVHRSGANLGLVTGDGSRQSGGHVEQVGAISAVPAAITKIADSILHQYALTYTLPDGVKPSDRVSITTTRKGISLFAPTRVADR
jgi:hypothetical protein